MQDHPNNITYYEASLLLSVSDYPVLHPFHPFIQLHPQRVHLDPYHLLHLAQQLGFDSFLQLSNIHILVVPPDSP